MVPPRVIRRLLSPALVGVELGLVLIFAAVTVLAVLAAPFTPRRRVLRIAAFGAAYMAMEIAVSLAALGLWLFAPRHWVGSGRRRAARHDPDDGWERRHFALLAWALGIVLGAARRTARFRIVIEGEAGGARLDGHVPLLVLARHAGPGDSFALAQLLLAHGRRVRIVLKGILQLDPAVDVLLNRLPACFLPPRAAPGEDLAQRVATLASTLDGCDALLVFPEGGNWTPGRRLKAIRHLRAASHEGAAQVAEAMEHVLPPRPAGFLACLECRPDLDVAAVAHTGLDDLVTAGDIWGALPLTVSMTVRWWWTPSELLPEGDDERLRWLTREWAIVDEWIDARKAQAALTQPGDA